jgi:multidrug efflux pump subunit AcrA (membrane-fusion protein)
MVNMKLQIVILVWLSGMVLIACSKKKEIHPQMRQLTEAVYASGTMVPENEYKVVASIQGYLQKALVKEGDSIKKGQLLFTLLNETQQAQIAAASKTVAKTIPVAAEDAPAVRDLEQRLASAKTRLRNDSIQYARYKNLYDQNAIAASTYDRYRLQYQTTLHEVESLEAQIKQQRLTAGLQLQEAQNQLQLAQTERSNELLKSYTAGKVFEVYKQTGDLVAPGQPIALIGSGNMIAKLLIDEDDLGKVKVGQKVLITMDAYPGKIFQAHVQKIYPLLNRQEQSFRVDALFDNVIPVQLYGLNLEANIVLTENVNALVIPKTALFKGDSVLLKKNGKVVKTKIHTGIEDKDYVQVVEGLDPSSTIIIEQ